MEKKYIVVVVGADEEECDNRANSLYTQSFVRDVLSVPPAISKTRARRSQKMDFVRKHWSMFEALEKAKWFAYGSSTLMDLIKAEFKYSEKTSTCDIFHGFRNMYELLK